MFCIIGDGFLTDLSKCLYSDSEYSIILLCHSFYCVIHFIVSFQQILIIQKFNGFRKTSKFYTSRFEFLETVLTVFFYSTNQLIHIP